MPADPQPPARYARRCSAVMYSRSPFRAHRCCSPGPGAAAYCDQIVRRREPAVSFVNIEQAEFWSRVAPTWLEQEEQLLAATLSAHDPAAFGVDVSAGLR